ncbi:MAG: PAS domain S-box protein, partial [Dechloromonas sp.]|nr:PAS domain S-box protein [Dechloromonas sp.]
MVVVDVTQKTQDARRLREREQYQQALLDTFPFMVWLKDEQGNFLSVNEPFARTFGWPSADSLIGKSDLDIASLELAESYRTDDREVLESGEPRIIEEWIETGDELRWFETFKSPVALDGQIIGTVGYARDLTEYKVMVAALRNSEAEFRSLFELSVVGSAQSDPLTGRLLRVNQKFCEITGYSAEELLALSFSDFTHPDDRDSNWQGYRAAMTGENDLYVVDKRYVRKDGSIVWVNVQLTAVRDEQNHVARSIAVIQDITIHRQAEAALREQLKIQDLLSKIAATVPGVICSFMLRPDGTTCIPYASAALYEFYGLQPEDVRDDATPLLSRVYADDVGRLNETITASASAMTPWRAEFRVHHPTRGILWIDGHSMPQREPDGSVLWHGYLMNITARKRSEEALRESERDLRLAQAVAQTGSWRLDVNKDELRWSEENYRIFGVPKGTPLSYETFLSTVHPDDQAFVDQAWRNALLGAPYDIEHRIVVAGEIKWVNERAELEFDPQGNLLGGFGSTQDISERKRSEAALFASESRFRL